MKEAQPWVRLAAATIIVKIKGQEGPDAWKVGMLPAQEEERKSSEPPPL
jgi:hypothetical protein